MRVSGKDIAPVIQAICGKALSPRMATYLPFSDASAYDILHAEAIVIESSALGDGIVVEGADAPVRAAKPKAAKRAVKKPAATKAKSPTAKAVKPKKAKAAKPKSGKGKK